MRHICTLDTSPHPFVHFEGYFSSFTKCVRRFNGKLVAPAGVVSIARRASSLHLR